MASARPDCSFTFKSKAFVGPREIKSPSPRRVEAMLCHRLDAVLLEPRHYDLWRISHFCFNSRYDFTTSQGVTMHIARSATGQSLSIASCQIVVDVNGVDLTLIKSLLSPLLDMSCSSFSDVRAIRSACVCRSLPPVAAQA